MFYFSASHLAKTANVGLDRQMSTSELYLGLMVSNISLKKDLYFIDSRPNTKWFHLIYNIYLFDFFYHIMVGGPPGFPNHVPSTLM